MAIKILKVSPEQAIKNLEKAMNDGYQTIEKIRAVVEKQKAITGSTTTPSSEMGEIYNVWHRATFHMLTDTFSSVWRAYYFKETKTGRYAASGDTAASPYEHDFEAKVKVLKDYYDSVMRDSDPAINIEGDLIFQAGKNIRYEKK